MIRLAAFLAVLLLSLSGSQALAQQSKLTVAGGYVSEFDHPETGTDGFRGVVVDLDYYLYKRLSLVGTVWRTADTHTDPFFGSSWSFTDTFAGGGVRIGRRWKRVEPSVHFLVGLGRQEGVDRPLGNRRFEDGSYTTTVLAVALGGSARIHATERVSVRLGLDLPSTGWVRFTTGLVVGLGR